jgi:hypothetical protein
MHVVSVMYPRGDSGSGFNFEYYVSVHLKLGFRLMQKHFGVVPEKALIQHPTRGMDDDPASARYATVCWVCFKSRADADLFGKVFAIEEVAQVLRADWANYCAEPPDFVLGEVLELSGIDILQNADALLLERGLAT